MKALNQLEIESIADHLRELLGGSPLQEVVVSGGWLLLRFYPGQDVWVVVDLQKPSPMVMSFPKKFPLALKKEKKPLQLFLNARFVGQTLQEVEVLHQFGRVVVLRFSQGELELRLIPRQTNAIARTEGKSLSWDKVIELKPTEAIGEFECRGLTVLREEWLADRRNISQTKSDPVAAYEKQKAKALIKKRKAAEEIEALLAENKELRYRALGDELKLRQSMDVSEEHRSLLQTDLSMAENMTAAFAKAKSLRDKREGTLARLNQVREDIQRLEAETYADVAKQRGAPKKAVPAKLQRGDLKLRKRELGDGLTAFMGKSAQDNLNLLRKARAWDFWLHLRDYPSAHAILFREKHQAVSPEHFRQVGAWLVAESLSASQQMGDFDLLICESRFVRPIKGDKLGRVNYSNERIQRIRGR